MELHRALGMLADPVEVLRGQGLHADPWQATFLRNRDPRVLLNCSRQSGKSTAAAALALHTLLFRPGSLVLLAAPTLRQSDELYRKVLAAYAALDRPVAARSKTTTHLELTNGSRLVALPGNEATIRSFSRVALVLLDEAARVPDDVYGAVRPMLAVSAGRLVCLSTPFGCRGFFHREWLDHDAHWLRLRVPWQDCPRILPAFIEQERRSLGDAWVRQEYECSFESTSGLVYPDFEAACAIDVWPNPVGKPFGGIDFGFRNPFCALWGVLDRDDVLWLRGERYLRQTPLHDHAAALPRNVTWFADPAGRTEREELLHAGLKVRAGRNDIRAGIAAVTARLRDGRLRVLRSGCPNLFAEARLYRYPDDGERCREEPIDADNHALAALRYLVSRLPVARRPAERHVG
jgi:hypothetical protein